MNLGLKIERDKDTDRTRTYAFRETRGTYNFAYYNNEWDSTKVFQVSKALFRKQRTAKLEFFR